MPNSTGLDSQERLNIRLESGQYKSIAPPLEWEDVPSFAVLTGENGTGKTQLLEALDGRLRPPRAGQNPFSNLRFSISPAFSPHEVLYIPSMAQRLSSSQVGLGQIQSHIQQLITHIRENKPQSHYHVPLFEAVKRTSGSSITPRTLLTEFANELFYHDPSTIEQAVAFHCANYEVDKANSLKKGSSLEETTASLGPPPWSQINDLLQSAEFSYRMVGADDLDLWETYRIRFQHKLQGDEVGIQDLSSGEITLVRLFLWLFVAKQKFRFPKLVLLDEPDSHLHPTLTWSFVRALHRGLVETQNCRLIMSTHRPETIAFAPEGSVFEMHRAHPRIRPSKGTEKTVALLTNNLVALVAGKRPVYVEDDDDVAFYKASMDGLLTEGEWPHAAEPHFISSSIGQGVSKDSGGKQKVKGWVKRVSQSGLLGLVKGVIDQDLGNPGGEGIVVLDRHEHENYLLDPLVVYSFLVEEGYSLPITLDPPMKLGDQPKIRELTETDMQNVADAVLAVVVAHLRPEPTSEEIEQVAVEYVSGKTVRLPKWLITRGGRELMVSARKGSGQEEWRRLSHKALLREYRRLRLVPRSLRGLLEECVSP